MSEPDDRHAIPPRKRGARRALTLFGILTAAMIVYGVCHLIIAGLGAVGADREELVLGGVLIALVISAAVLGVQGLLGRSHSARNKR